MAFRKNVYTGWVESKDNIFGNGYTCMIYYYSEPTIDTNCDALNGWYATYTKFKFVLTVGDYEGTIIVNRKADARKIYDMFDKFVTSEDIKIAFDAIRNFLN